MKLELNKLKFKSIKAPYPIGYIDNFLEYDECKKLSDEINYFSSFDDLVMNGRNRVNKGSNKFSKYLKTSPALYSLYNQLNKIEFYLKMKNILDDMPVSKSWRIKLDNFNFSKESYGEQSFNLIKFMRKSKIIASFFKNKINLDIDFSKSNYGYFRNAHRDRDTRIVSFLLYLNSINEVDGGQFEVFKLKEEFSTLKNFDRFPKKDSTIKLSSFPPKAGQLFLFSSTPNSYHGVSKFLSKEKKRIFVYGSYSLDRSVQWISNDKKI